MTTPEFMSSDLTAPRLRAFLVFFFILAVLEKLLDFEFVCPCEHVSNIVLCVFYAIVPSIACFVFTMHFVKFVPLGGEEAGTEDTAKNIKPNMYYSFLMVLTWISLFCFDGRYIACACTNWQGIYVKSDNLALSKWCRPTGNETTVLESQQKILKIIFISEVSGFVGFLFLTFLILLPTISSHNGRG